MYVFNISLRKIPSHDFILVFLCNLFHLKKEEKITIKYIYIYVLKKINTCHYLKKKLLPYVSKILNKR